MCCKLLGYPSPYFYEENSRTVTGLRYLEVLQDKFYPELSQLTFNDPELDPYSFFMQDGARPHSLNAARQFLSLKFETRTIGDRLNTPWPARSPDLTPCDFFLCGWIKDNIYKTMPIINRQHLKDVATDVISSIVLAFCQNACRSIKNILEKCLQQNGGHFEHLL